MPKRAPGQPRGVKMAYCFFLQKCREEHKNTNPDDKVDFKAFSRKCADKWKCMTIQQKKHFEALSKKDRERHEVEMNAWRKANPEAAAAVGKGGKRKRKDKDPNEPKRPLSAFFLFCGDRRASIKAQDKSLSVGEISKQLGQEWAAIAPEEKAKYEAQQAKKKQIYEVEMAAYKKSCSGGHSDAKKVKKAAVKEPSDNEEDDESEEEESEEDEDSD